VPTESVPVRTSAEGTSDGPSSEVRLLQDTAQGNQAAYRALVQRHLRPLLAIGRRMLGEDAEAEDVAQEALVRLWRNAGQIEIGEAGLRPWLNRVTANLCLDRLRSRKNAPRTVDEMPDVGTPAVQQLGIEEAQLAKRVDRALQDLPERQRLALVLFHYQGLSQGEAAAALDISQDALESLLARARRSLKAALADEWRALLPDGGQDMTLGWKKSHGEHD
jgi:RNA polymerase sigma-70 factor, ECF subfamily